MKRSRRDDRLFLRIFLFSRNQVVRGLLALSACRLSDFCESDRKSLGIGDEHFYALRHVPFNFNARLNWHAKFSKRQRFDFWHELRINFDIYRRGTETSVRVVRVALDSASLISIHSCIEKVKRDFQAHDNRDWFERTTRVLAHKKMWSTLIVEEWLITRTVIIINNCNRIWK